MDFDLLLKEFGDEDPSGEDMEYDPVFTAMEIAGQHGEEKQAGDTIIPGDDPDYKEVKENALEILGQSHDLRAAIYLAEAQLRLSGLPGFAEATTYIRRCLEEFWDSCHPQLDEDDGDPTMRINAVLALADDARILRGVRRAPLTASRMFGAISLRDISVAEGDIVAPADMDNPPDSAGIAAAFQDTDPDTLREIAAAAATALLDVEAIDAKFSAEIPGQGPELDPLIKFLKQIKTRLGAVTGEPVDEDEIATDEDGAPAVASSSGGGGGGINSPADVVNALERIIAYYQRYEPSSPVPLMLQRTKSLVGADFLTIVKNMAPGGLDNVNLIGGLEAEEN